MEGGIVTYCNRVVNNWNGLPDSVVNTEAVLDFERRLDKVWKDEEQKFDYTATVGSLDHRQIRPHDHTIWRKKCRSGVTDLSSLFQKSSVSICKVVKFSGTSLPEQSIPSFGVVNHSGTSFILQRAGRSRD